MGIRTHRRGVSLFAALLLIGTAHVAGPGETASAELPAQALDPTTDRPTDSPDPVGEPETPRWRLVEEAGAAPGAVLVGEPFFVTVDLGRSITGFDGVLRYDPDAIEFAGAAATSDDSTLFQNDDHPGRVALTIVSEPQDLTQRAALEARLWTTSPGAD